MPIPKGDTFKMKDIYGFTYNELFEVAIEKPMMAQLEITRNCNQHCFFCFRHCNPHQKFIDRPMKDWKFVVDKLIEIGVRELNFSGGEIFLFKNASKLFKYSKKKGIKKIVANTNGFIDFSDYDLSNIDELVFSVHGIGRLHDKIVGANGSFKALEKAMSHVLRYGREFKVGINTVVVPQNITALSEIYDHFKDKEFIFHAFNLSIDQENLPNKLQEYESLFRKYFKFLRTVPEKKRKLRHGMQNIFIRDKDFFHSPIPLPHCAAGKYKLVIDYRGDVYPCRYFQNEKFLCGNIFKQDLADIWRTGKGFKFFRDIVLKNELSLGCQDCFKSHKCRGGCLAWRIYNKELKYYDKDIRCEFGNAYLGG